MVANVIRGGLRRVVGLLPADYRKALQGSTLARRIRRRFQEWELRQDLRQRGGMQWSASRACPERLYDAGGAVIGGRLYVLGGFHGLDSIGSDVLVFDLGAERWSERFPMPADLPQSHCAIAGDGERFLYAVSGQLGKQCSPAVPAGYALDTATRRWLPLPPLPAARYAGTMQLWRGRLHYVGGAGADRWTPMADHWSLAVSDGAATEPAWREEQPIPIGGMHRSSAVAGDVLYVFGGQQGDFTAIAGAPDFRCTGLTHESYLDCTFRLDTPSGPWSRLADMPIAASHCDFATIVHDGSVFLFGGQIFKHPESFQLRLTDAVQRYDIAADRWSIAGHLPYRLKFPIAAERDGTVFLTTGQRGGGAGDIPADITRDTWSAALPTGGGGGGAGRLTSLKGRRILLVSHDLRRAGAPLLLMETAQEMIRSGATVTLATAADDTDGWTLAAEHGVALIPSDAAMALAPKCDLIVANSTAKSTKNWVRRLLAANPGAARRLLWWVHEIDIEYYDSDRDLLEQAALALFGSVASERAWREAGVAFASTRVVHLALTDGFLETAAQDRQPFQNVPHRSGGRTQLLDREQIRASLGLAPDDFLVTTIANYEPRKGQDMLLRTLSRLAAEQGLPVRLLIVGFRDGVARIGFFKDLSAEELQVISPARAYVGQPDIGAFYLASDAYAMNSQGMTGRGECFGRVTIEAMAFGLPVLGTDAGGTPEILADGVTGLLHPVGEAGQAVLAENLAALVRDRDRARAMGAAGRAEAQRRFRADRMYGELDGVLKALLGRD